MCEEYRMSDWQIEEEQAKINEREELKKYKSCLESIKDVLEAPKTDLEGALEEIKYYVEELYENI